MLLDRHRPARPSDAQSYITGSLLQALLSVYSEDGDICFSQSESEQLEGARLLLDAPQHSEVDATYVRISGCVRLPDLTVEGSAVTVKFSLPAEYPTAKPHLQLIANAPRCVRPWSKLISIPCQSIPVFSLGDL